MRFEQRLNHVRPLQSAVEQLVKMVENEEDADIRRQMTEKLLEKAKTLPNRAYAMALRENKHWANILKRLEEDNL